MSLAFLVVGSLGNLLYVCGSSSVSAVFNVFLFVIYNYCVTLIYPFYNNIFVVLHVISLLFCMLHSAVRSSGVRLSHGYLYLRCFKVSLVRVMYLLRLVSDSSSTCVGYSVIVMMSLKVVQSNKVIIWY